MTFLHLVHCVSPAAITKLYNNLSQIEEYTEKGLNIMNAQQGDQRWHLEEEELFPAHEVGLHHKQQHCAADEGKDF